MQRGFLYLFLLVAVSACGRPTDSDVPERGTPLPYDQAPLDTLQSLEAASRVDTFSLDSRGNPPDSGRQHMSLGGLPAPGDLRYVRYTNEPYGYSVAYPDTLLSPGEPIGESRGMTFVSAAGDVRMMIYAEDRQGYEDLDEQFTAAVDDPQVRITYRARDESFYVVSGLSGEHVFYEKAVADESTITTFRIRYPIEMKAYYDAVTALIAGSLRS